jgi:hypothetical protein
MTSWSLLAGVLIIGTASVIVLGHDYKHRSILPPISEEKGSSEAQQANSSAPPIVEFQNIKSALMPQPAEIAAIPAQKTDLASPSVAELQNVESASMPQPAEIAATPAQEPDAPKPAVAKPKKAKQKSANKRRYAQRQNYQHVRYNFGPTAPSIMGAPGAY